MMAKAAGNSYSLPPTAVAPLLDSTAPWKDAVALMDVKKVTL